MVLFRFVRFFLTVLLLVIIAACSSQADEQGAGVLSTKPDQKVSLFATKLPGARFMVLTKDQNILITRYSHGQFSMVLKDSDGDGKSDGQINLIYGLDNPSGIYLDGDQLYIAEETQIWRFDFNEKSRKVSNKTLVLKGMPSGGHWTRMIKKGPVGTFYVAIGSSCNVCREKHKWRASVIRFKPNNNANQSEEPTVYATGLRNMVGFDWHPKTGMLYGGDNGRDWLGDNMPPEEINEIKEGGFYGWPYYYGDNIPDEKYKEFLKTAKMKKPEKPVFKIQAHSAPLSFKFLRHQNNRKTEALVGLHGSWNHSGKVGYKVIRLTFHDDGTITKDDFLTGVLKNGRVLGRPVDVVEDKDGVIYVSDDGGGRIWKIEKK